jgi:hypothetical protein
LRIGQAFGEGDPVRQAIYNGLYSFVGVKVIALIAAR